MACDHLQPQDLMALADAWLRERGIPERQWPGAIVYHGENTPDGMWGSVAMELERRRNEWIVTRLDRNREPLQADQCGLRVLIEADGRGQKAEVT